MMSADQVKANVYWDGYRISVHISNAEEIDISRAKKVMVTHYSINEVDRQGWFEPNSSVSYLLRELVHKDERIADLQGQIEELLEERNSA